jgi:hypothetical protein
MPDGHSKQKFNIYFKRFSAGNYEVSYNVLSTYDWSSLYNEICVDAAVDRLSVVTQPIYLAVHSGHTEKRKCAACFFWKIKSLHWGHAVA